MDEQDNSGIDPSIENMDMDMSGSAEPDTSSEAETETATKVVAVKKTPVKKAVKAMVKKAPAKKTPVKAATKKAVAKKAPVKGTKKAVKKAAKAPKEPKEPRVKKADLWLPKVIKYLAKYPDGKTRSELYTHFEVSDFGGALKEGEWFTMTKVEGQREQNFSLTKAGKARAVKGI